MRGRGGAGNREGEVGPGWLSIVGQSSGVRGAGPLAVVRLNC